VRKKTGAAREVEWDAKFAAFKRPFQSFWAARFERRVIKGELPADFEQKRKPSFKKRQDNKARTSLAVQASQNAIRFFGGNVA